MMFVCVACFLYFIGAPDNQCQEKKKKKQTFRRNVVMIVLTKISFPARGACEFSVGTNCIEKQCVCFLGVIYSKSMIKPLTIATGFGLDIWDVASD